MQQDKDLMLSLSKHERGYRTKPSDPDGDLLTHFTQHPET